jgi:LL-diaminopimelate aminotransferase
LKETAVVITPGSGFGKSGEGYVRFSLTVPNTRLQEAVGRIQTLRI